MDYTDLYNFQDSSGIIVPNDSDVISGIQTKFKEIFGSDLDVSSTTAVGRLIEAIASVVKSSLGVTAQSANQFNINTATGVYLDSLAEIYDLYRNQGTKTIVPITVTLTTNATVVPAGSLLLSDDSNIFLVNEDISAKEQIGAYWYGYGTATAKDYGPISGDSGTINKIQSSVIGWIGVTNDAAIQIGSLIESDGEFRERIKLTRPVGMGFKDSLIAKLKRLEDVTSCCVLENSNLVDDNQNGVVVPGHFVYICVSAAKGDEIDEKIASAIVSSKSAGVGMVNDLQTYSEAKLTQKIVKASNDPNSTTLVSFYRAINTYVSVNVTVTTKYYTGTDYKSDVINAVVKYINSVDIGNTVVGTYVASAIMNDTGTIGVTSITMSRKDGSQVDLQDIAMLAYEKPYCNSSDVNVQI